MLEVEKQVVLDLLDTSKPLESATSDVPIIETKPDATPEQVVPAEPEKSAESAPADKPEDSSATPEPKKSQGVQKRIDELTRQREDEKRRAEAAEARELRILSALERATGVGKEPEKTVDTEPVKPLSADFTNPEAYDEALQNWISEKAAYIADRKVTQRMEEEKRKQIEETQALQARKVQEDFVKRKENVMKKYPDYQEVAESPDVQVSFPMAYAILQSEQGPEIQYYLGKHPEEAKRISSFNTPDGSPDVARQLVELGAILSKVSEPLKPVSAAPPPLKAIKSGTEPATKSVEEMSMEEYAAKRKPELNARRPGVRY